MENRGFSEFPKVLGKSGCEISTTTPKLCAGLVPAVGREGVLDWGACIHRHHNRGVLRAYSRSAVDGEDSACDILFVYTRKSDFHNLHAF